MGGGIREKLLDCGYRRQMQCTRRKSAASCEHLVTAFNCVFGKWQLVARYENHCSFAVVVVLPLLFFLIGRAGGGGLGVGKKNILTRSKEQTRCSFVYARLP